MHPTSSVSTTCRALANFALWMAVVIAALAAAPAGTASQLIDRNTQNVSLEVNAEGEAMVTYMKDGQIHHVLAWGAINALPPTSDASQVAFKLDYSGGWGTYHRSGYWNGPGWVCLPYTGPRLSWQVAACDSPDGSYWALQAWQHALPDLGLAPTRAQQAWDLDLSHWTGALPVLAVTLDWSYRRYDHLFGTLTYGASGVYGFASTRSGVPLDSFGRNIYVDTYNSAYGPGWRRENSFLTHGPLGSFCYGFYPHGDRPSGAGSQYRVTVIGPGVTPDIAWQGTAPGPYNPTQQAASYAQEQALHDPACSAY